MENNKIKTCIKCHKEINDNKNYFRITEFNEDKKVDEFFMHKYCWEEQGAARKGIKEALGLITALKNKAKKMGVIDEEPIIMEVTN